MPCMLDRVSTFMCCNSKCRNRCRTVSGIRKPQYMVRRIVMIGQFSTYSHHLYIINPFHPEDLLRSHRTGDPGVVANLIVPGVGGIHFGGCKGADDDADDDKEISWIKIIWVVHVCRY